jgi:hypothetical protein
LQSFVTVVTGAKTCAIKGDAAWSPLPVNHPQNPSFTMVWRLELHIISVMCCS